MPNVRWTRRISAKLWLIAVSLLLCSLAVGTANFLAFETFRRDARTLVTLSRARKQSTEYLYLAHRLFDPSVPREQTANVLRAVMASVDRRYDHLSHPHGLVAAALSDVELQRSLASDQSRWRRTTRPALTRLLVTDDKQVAQPLLATLSESTPHEVKRLRELVLARQERLDRSVTRLQILQGMFFLVQLLVLAGLLLLARSIAARARVLLLNSERLGENALSTLLPVDGGDEIAVANQSFNSTILKLRDLFQAEREALGARLQTIASMNTALAGAAPSMFLRGRGDGGPGVAGSIPPSIPPDSLPPPGASPASGLEVKPRRRVLLVDDDQQVLRGFARILKADGYDVITAGSAAEAIEHVVAGGLDTIVSDIEMPGMDGIQLLRRVRERNLLVPVVLVTGKPAVNSAAEAVELGAFQYLMKPVDKNSFRQVVEHAVRVHDVARTRQLAAEIMGEEAALGADRAGLEASWNRAMDSLWMAYQPIVDVRQRSVFGYEALLRSDEPSLPNPIAVVDASERLERLDLLGRNVRSRAAQPMLDSQSDVLLFVNLHVRDLLDPSLSDPEQPLSKIASRVVLEITERSSLEEVRDARKRATALRELGFRIAVDDMGAGYAGLSSFALLEPEIVKLDMSLIRDVHLNPIKQKVIRSMTTLAKDMGILIIAEGVETAAERDALIALDCDLLQGYLFAKPGRPFPDVIW